MIPSSTINKRVWKKAMVTRSRYKALSPLISPVLTTTLSSNKPSSHSLLPNGWKRNKDSHETKLCLPSPLSFKTNTIRLNIPARTWCCYHPMKAKPTSISATNKSAFEITFSNHLSSFHTICLEINMKPSPLCPKSKSHQAAYPSKPLNPQSYFHFYESSFKALFLYKIHTHSLENSIYLLLIKKFCLSFTHVNVPIIINMFSRNYH